MAEPDDGNGADDKPADPEIEVILDALRRLREKEDIGSVARLTNSRRQAALMDALTRLQKALSAKSEIPVGERSGAGVSIGVLDIAPILDAFHRIGDASGVSLAGCIMVLVAGFGLVIALGVYWLYYRKYYKATEASRRRSFDDSMDIAQVFVFVLSIVVALGSAAITLG